MINAYSNHDTIKASQEFISSKFDELSNTVDNLKSANHDLRSQNEQLKERIAKLETNASALDCDMEHLKEYIRRDMLEIHGVPVSSNENTNNITIQIGQLLDINIEKSDISISHRLPSKEGYIPPIIVKFTRRDVRNLMLNQKKRLRSISSLDLGLNQESKLYLNESLTQRGRLLLKAVKSFKRDFNYKFVWTSNGKVFLRKNNSQTSQVHSFVSKEKFEEFKSRIG